MDKITVYTDGSALSNGRPGSGCGWAYKLMYKGQARMKSGGAIGETNKPYGNAGGFGSYEKYN